MVHKIFNFLEYSYSKLMSFVNQSMGILLYMHEKTFSHGVIQLAVKHHWVSLHIALLLHSQQICINFCSKLGHLFGETIQIIKVTFRNQQNEWNPNNILIRTFGQESIESGRQPKNTACEKIAQLLAAIKENRQLT